MNKFVRILSLVFLLCFFVPYVSVSCVNQKVAEVNGFQGAIGQDQVIEDMAGDEDGTIELEASIPLIVTIVLGIVGCVLLLSTIKKKVKYTYLISMVIYGMTVVLNIFIPLNMQKTLEGNEDYIAAITLKMEWGYYVSLGLSVVITGMLIYLVARPKGQKGIEDNSEKPASKNKFKKLIVGAAVILGIAGVVVALSFTDIIDFSKIGGSDDAEVSSNDADDESDQDQNSEIAEDLEEGDTIKGYSEDSIFMNVLESTQAIMPIFMPQIEGLSEGDAIQLLDAADLTLGNITYQHNDDVAAGLIISASMATGLMVENGEAIDLSVSLGEAFLIDASNLSDYTGVWISSSSNNIDNLFSEGGNILDIEIVDDVYVQGYYYSYGSSPYNRVAGIYFISKIVNNSFQIDYANDGWYNSGTITFTIKEDGISAILSNEITDSSAMWSLSGSNEMVRAYAATYYHEYDMYGGFDVDFDTASGEALNKIVNNVSTAQYLIDSLITINVSSARIRTEPSLDSETFMIVDYGTECYIHDTLIDQDGRLWCQLFYTPSDGTSTAVWTAYSNFNDGEE